MKIKSIFEKFLLSRSGVLKSHFSSYIFESKFKGFNYVGKGVKVVKSELGLFSYVNNNSIVINSIVGPYCSVGPEVLLGGLGRHPIDRLSTHRMFYSDRREEWKNYCVLDDFEEKPLTVIGADVWIGARAIILDGVTVGVGSIIAAGAVVTKDVPPYSIVMGIPAKVVKKRFSEEKIFKLIEDKWWNKSLDTIKIMTAGGVFSKKMEK